MAKETESTFWGHLDDLRKVFVRTAFIVFTVSALAFVFKDFVFDIVFAPHQSNFITYRLLGDLATITGIESIRPGDFSVELISIELANQFLTHISISVYAGVIIASPYFIYLLFGFISPALYPQEKKYTKIVLICSIFLFALGALLNYFVIFPLSFRFLATYQVSEFVINKISLSSYISTFTTLSIMLGAVFEIPVIAFLFAKIGLLNTEILKKFRRHAIIVILIIAAVITPTADAITLILVSLPMYMLYELSIIVVAKTKNKEQEKLSDEEDKWEDNPYKY